MAKLLSRETLEKRLKILTAENALMTAQLEQEKLCQKLLQDLETAELQNQRLKSELKNLTSPRQMPQNNAKPGGHYEDSGHGPVWVLNEDSNEFQV